MVLVQDPGFWKRFSTAVHRDDEEKQSTATTSPDGRPSLKHSYVLYPSPSLSSPPPTPTSIHAPLFPQYNPVPQHTFTMAETQTNNSSRDNRQKKKKNSRWCVCCWLCGVVFGLGAAAGLVMLVWMSIIWHSGSDLD
jgi:hypothetical protein